jgi:hypothetical protein
MGAFRGSVDKNQKSSEGYADDVYIVVSTDEGVLATFVLLSTPKIHDNKGCAGDVHIVVNTDNYECSPTRAVGFAAGIPGTCDLGGLY